VGRALVERLQHAPVVAVDIDQMDVTDPIQVESVIERTLPDVIFHLAGAKHAFEGELEPERVTAINVTGTGNVLRAAKRIGAKVVFSSTCKACDPETGYGASKLLAERLVLNAGQTVVRYYNIPESDGNVFRLWENIPEDEPIPYTDCWRYFISMEQALELTIAAADMPPARYTVNPGLPRHMRTVAEGFYPGRELVEVPRRRGDRHKEPLKAQCEDMWPVNGSELVVIHSEYDAWRTREPLEANALTR
jgi:FlaA1/EpsC-like NDP-sugar epimerase